MLENVFQGYICNTIYVFHAKTAPVHPITTCAARFLLCMHHAGTKEVRWTFTKAAVEYNPRQGALAIKTLEKFRVGNFHEIVEKLTLYPRINSFFRGVSYVNRTMLRILSYFVR